MHAVLQIQLLRPAWLSYLTIEQLLKKNQKQTDIEITQLINDMKMLGTNKNCATVPCDVFASVLDPKSSQVFRDIDAKRKDSDKTPKCFDTGIYVDQDYIFQMTKGNIKKNEEEEAAKLIQLL